MAIAVRLVSRSALPRLRDILAAAARFYPGAERVADEKLFEPGPDAPVHTLGAWAGERLIGVGVVSGAFIRVIAVAPEERERGAGTALLSACERAVRDLGVARARIAAQPGNYLAPGIAAEDAATLTWLERRGYLRRGENENLLVDVASNARVSWERFAALSGPLGAAGYALRRADPDRDGDLCARVAVAFSPAWAFEVERALAHVPTGVHVARGPDGDLAGFAAHDAENRGLGWFGPAGTSPAHRGRGIGAALLVACLADIADAGHPTATIAWIGPRRFYERSVGTVGVRRYIVLDKELLHA